VLVGHEKGQGKEEEIGFGIGITLLKLFWVCSYYVLHSEICTLYMYCLQS
jgi:hypothetical protein